MNTRIYGTDEQDLKTCARLIRSGEVVAFPTETVYGLGGNALSEDSVKKIYAAKGRPSDNPLIVHVASVEAAFALADTVPPVAEKCMRALMPGPFTAVLKKRPFIPDCVTGGLDTVAIRLPAHPVARRLIELAGVPVCAPSANTSGKPSPTAAAHVKSDLGGRIPAIIDGGSCTVGVESTVVDFTTDPPRLLRAGGTTLERIESVAGRVEIYGGGTVALCPGMKYKHYSPEAEVYVAADGDAAEKLRLAYDGFTAQGKRAAIMCLSGTAARMGDRLCYDAGESKADYARSLFATLRRADDEGRDVLLAEGVDSSQEGASIMNRLMKAAGGKTL